MPRILVTNDDGVHSPGIKALAEVLAPLGEITVVAPIQEASAIGHALTLRRPLRIDGLSANRGVAPVEGLRERPAERRPGLVANRRRHPEVPLELHRAQQLRLPRRVVQPLVLGVDERVRARRLRSWSASADPRRLALRGPLYPVPASGGREPDHRGWDAAAAVPRPMVRFRHSRRRWDVRPPGTSVDVHGSPGLRIGRSSPA